MGRFGGAVVLCLFLMLVGQPRRARAGERVDLAAVLRVEPGATCLQPNELSARIAQRLDSADVTAGIRLEVLGDPTFSRFVTLRVLRGGKELAERRFEPGPAGCEDLHAAVAMAVALACKAVRESSAPGAGQPAVDTGARTGGLQLSLALLGAVGVLPGVQLGGRLGLAWAWSRTWSLLLGASGLRAPARALLPGAELELSALTGRLQLCAALAELGRMQASVCAGPEAGALRAMGRGFAPSQRAGAAYAALAADLHARLALSGPWSVQIAAQPGVSRVSAARDAASLRAAAHSA